MKKSLLGSVGVSGGIAIVVALVKMLMWLGAFVARVDALEDEMRDLRYQSEERRP